MGDVAGSIEFGVLVAMLVGGGWDGGFPEETIGAMAGLIGADNAAEAGGMAGPPAAVAEEGGGTARAPGAADVAAAV